MQCNATLQKLQICHRFVKLLSHFGLRSNYLEESRECGFSLEALAVIMIIYACARSKTVGGW
jgi:hypothetical protein